MMKLESLQTTRNSHSFKQMLREVLNNNVWLKEGVISKQRPEYKPKLNGTLSVSQETN